MTDDLQPNSNSVDRKTVGQMLLHERDEWFQQICDGRELDSKIVELAKYTILFAAVYGFCLGSYSGFLQMLAASIKMPLLFMLTLAICSPALYTFNVILGSKLAYKQILVLLLTMTYLISLILISLAPILLFFILTSYDYNFSVLLNFSMCGIAGVFGLILLKRGMEFITKKSELNPNRLILNVWIFIYMFVGNQLAWTLRPFVGPQDGFVLFRELDGNIYVSILRTFMNILKSITLE